MLCNSFNSYLIWLFNSFKLALFKSWASGSIPNQFIYTCVVYLSLALRVFVAARTAPAAAREPCCGSVSRRGSILRAARGLEECRPQYSWHLSSVAGLTGSGAPAQSWPTGLVALWHAGSFWSRDRTCVSCIGRQIPYHWATREALVYIFD